MYTRRIALLLTAMLLTSCASAQDMVSGASPERDNRQKGYLAPNEIPDGVALLPQPPAPGSAAAQLDIELNQQALKLRDTERWKLAAQDAIPDPGRAFSCALGLPLSSQQSPALYDLLMRSGADAGAAVSPTKRHYQRDRPFLVNDQPICSSGDQRATAKDGSYPSGHTAAGWIWALILTALAPERSDELLARGYAYGQSRAICNLHWQSDVTQGRVIAAALLARLLANDQFRADLDRARQEIEALKVSDFEPSEKCAAEAAALTVTSGNALQ